MNDQTLSAAIQIKRVVEGLESPYDQMEALLMATVGAFMSWDGTTEGSTKFIEVWCERFRRNLPSMQTAEALIEKVTTQPTEQ